MMSGVPKGIIVVFVTVALIALALVVFLWSSESASTIPLPSLVSALDSDADDPSASITARGEARAPEFDLVDPEATDAREGRPDVGAGAPRKKVLGDRKHAFEVRGRVVTEGGKAVEGARVRVHKVPPRSIGYANEVAADVLTERDGAFVASFVASFAIDVGVVVTNPNFAVRIDRKKVRQEGGPIDFGELALDHGIEILGHVTTGTGAAPPAARVTWFDQKGDALLARYLDPIDCDARGQYRFVNAPRTNFYLIARADGFASTASPLLPPRGVPSGTPQHGTHRVDAGRMTLQRGTMIEGSIKSEHGIPLSGARLTATAAFDKRAPRTLTTALQRQAESDGDGRFVIDDVSGRVTVEAHAKGHVTEQRQVRAEGNRVFVEFRLRRKARLQGVVVDNASGRPIEAFSVRARRVPAPKPANATHIAKTTTDTVREALANTRTRQRVDLLGPSGKRAAWLPPPIAHPRGQFELDDLDPGTYLLDVAADHYITSAQGPIDVATGGSPLVVRLDRGVSLRGRIRGRTTLTPVKRARVELLAPALEEQPPSLDPLVAVIQKRERDLVLEETRTRGDGSFRLAPRKPGTYRLRVRDAKGFADAIITPVTLAPDREAQERLVELDEACKVYGTVRGLGNEQRAHVLFASTSGKRFEVSADAAGNYASSDLAAGAWFVRMRIDGQSWGPLRLALEAVAVPGRDEPDMILRPGEQRRLDFDAKVSTLGRMFGTARLDGREFEGAIMRLVPHDAAALDKAHLDSVPKERKQLAQKLLKAALRRKSDASGSYDFDPVPRGRYTLETRIETKKGTVTVTQPVEIGPSIRHDVDVRTATLTLRPTVRSTGQPAKGLFVAVALEAEARGIDRTKWRSLPSARFVRARTPTVEVPMLQRGRYLWFARGGSFEMANGSFDLARDQEVRIEVARR
ncbi:MAG: carboxypeptidase regulatory-like domain-containing protein [Planctomycetes bacterium]|nr:carboxypeptidase regulatory-like domain-containing protein [Planctomycetota bacterium]